MLKSLLRVMVITMTFAMSSLCLLFSILIKELHANDWEVDARHPTLKELAALEASIPQSRWERLPEAKVDYENLKRILFGIVSDIEIESRYDHIYVDIDHPSHCVVGRSSNRVSANIPFTEVVQLYDAWAAENGWRNDKFREIRGKRYMYRDPHSTKAYQTELKILLLSDTPPSAMLMPDYTSYYRLDLYYVDHSCDED